MGFLKINDWRLDGELASNSDLCVVFLSATDCPSCQVPREEFRRLAEEYPAVRFYEIDLMEHPGVSNRYFVSRVPTTLILNENGEIERHVGPGMGKMLRRILGQVHGER